MNIEALNYFCPDCAEWYDGDKIEYELIPAPSHPLGSRRFYPCDCGGPSGRQDADEIHVQKPYAAIKAEILHMEKEHLEERVKDLDQRIEELGGYNP